MSTEPDGAHHGRRGEVLAGDELEAGGLALDLAVDERRDLDVGVGVGWEGHADPRRVARCGGRAERWRSAGGQNSASSSVIWSTRRAWRPPSNAVARNSVDDLLGEADADDAGADRQHVGVVVRPGPCGRCRGRCRARRARRGPCWRASCSPWPLPPSTMPTSASPSRTERPTAGADRRIVDRLGRVRAVVVDLVALAEQHRDEVLLELEAGVVGADGDALAGTRCRSSVPSVGRRHPNGPDAVDETSGPPVRPGLGPERAGPQSRADAGSSTVGIGGPTIRRVRT